jgi:hypothetical protein
MLAKRMEIHRITTQRYVNIKPGLSIARVVIDLRIALPNLQRMCAATWSY